MVVVVVVEKGKEWEHEESLIFYMLKVILTIISLPFIIIFSILFAPLGFAILYAYTKHWNK